MNYEDLLKNYKDAFNKYMELIKYWRGEGFEPDFVDEIDEVKDAYKAKEAAWEAYKEFTD